MVKPEKYISHEDQKILVRSKPLVITVIVLFLTFIAVIMIDIPIARQVVGFLYLTFVPGFVLMTVLSVDMIDTISTFFLAGGFSIAFLMVVGLLVNELGLLFGIMKPLSTIPLMAVLNSIILGLCFIIYLKGKNIEIPMIRRVKSNAFIILVFCLPILLSIVGAYSVNVSERNNSLLLLMIISISLLVIMVFFKRMIHPVLYPFLLMAISIALLLHSSLITTHINGFDIQHEYRFMRITQESSHWISNTIDLSTPQMSSLLSISILPTIYWTLLNLDGIWILKIIYPIIFTFVPLVLYYLYRTWVSEKTAFFASFFVMANNVFFGEMLTLGRQMIAELFFVLLFFTLYNKKMNNINKTICFIFFSFALVVSHYAISYVFMFIISLIWLSQHILRKNYPMISTGIKTSFLLIYSTIMLAWYIYVSSSATFNELLRVKDYIFRSIFTEFFNIQARGNAVLMGIGLSIPPSLIHAIGRAFAYTTELLIIIGFITIMIKRKENANAEYLVLSSWNMVLLGLCIAIPRFAGNLGMARFYHIVLLLLAPCGIVGGKTLFGVMLQPFARARKKLKDTLALGLVLVVLVFFFFFQTGLIYEITGVASYSIPLSKYRFDRKEYVGQALMNEEDIFGIKWLSEYDAEGAALVYSDPITDNILVRGYGMIPPDRTRTLVSNTTQIETNGVVYLRWTNLVHGIIGFRSNLWDTAPYINSTLSGMSKNYSNGGCEMYKKNGL